MWKKLLLLLIVLALVGLVGATIYVNNMDWNKHKDQIARQFSAATGKEIEFNGSVSFNIFPSPSLEASHVRIYNGSINSTDKSLLVDIKKIVAKLSISSLLSGNFNVEKMSMVEPEFFVELYPDGRLNWQSLEGTSQDFRVESIEVSLDSMMIENAKLHLISTAHDINTTLDNLNAEVISQSLFGPYRIEGSYSKKGIPGGFAISLGTFSEIAATSVQAVLSHPQSESYVRFDGTILLKNDAVNGNLIFESQNPVNFFNSNFRKLNISDDYEYPMALSIEIKTDKSEIALSNIVLKYGATVGAGNILIPRIEQQIGDRGMQRRRVDAVFNMTEFQFEPVVQLVKDFIHRYDGNKEYIPECDFDIIADLKAVKTTYNNQIVRDFDMSVDFMDNIFKLQNLSATLPGDNNLKIKGEIYPVEKKLTYGFDISSTGEDFAKTVEWLGYDLRPLSKNVYKKSAITAELSGTLETVKLAPFDITLDRTKAGGNLGLVRNQGNNRWFLILNTDNINFDNYVAPLPKELEKASLQEKLDHYFTRLAKLGTLDAQFRYNQGSGIFNRTPFEALGAEATLKGGAMTLSDFRVKSVASADVTLKGELSGFGKSPEAKNLSYTINVKDTRSFAEKFDIPTFGVNLGSLSTFSGNGLVTGNMNRAAVRTTSKLGNIDSSYTGEIAKQNNVYNYNGKLELRAPDFVKFLNDMSVNYTPSYPLGLFRMTSNVRGHPGAFIMKEVVANVGANAFSGDVVYVKRDGRNQLQADVKANSFELEKFFYNKAKDEKGTFRTAGNPATFLRKPTLSPAKIDYSWLQGWDIEGRFSVESLSLNKNVLKNASGTMVLKQDVVRLSKFSGENGEGTVEANLELDIPADAKLSGVVDFKNIGIRRANWSGTIYGLTKGTLTAKLTVNTSASSEDALLSQLSGNVSFGIQNPVVKGWNFYRIVEDLRVRDVADGFLVLARENLSQGETAFDMLQGEATMDNGGFTITASLSNEDAIVDVTSRGNLKSWMANSAMTVEFQNIEGVTGFDFSLDGTLTTPALDVDISRVEEIYDSHWERVANEAKATEQARVTRYRILMDQQQEKAHDLKDKLDTTVVADYMAQSRLATDEKMLARYADVRKQIEEANAILDSIFAKDAVRDIDDALIESLKAQNKKIASLIAKADAGLKAVHAEDVKLRLNESYNNIFSMYNQSRALSTRYLQSYGEYDKRLAAIKTSFTTKYDETMNRHKARIEESVLAIDRINSEIAAQNVFIQGVSDVDELERYFVIFSNAERGARAELDNIIEAAAALSAYAEERVSAEERAHAQRIYEEEATKKLQENTGQLTVGGRTVTVQRDLEEIERVEDSVKNHEVRVLDFSSTSTSTGTVTRGPRVITTETTEETIVIRRDIGEGDAVPVGGVIIKQ